MHFMGRLVHRLKQCPRNQRYTQILVATMEEIGVLLGFLLKHVAPSSCLLPFSQLMVKSVMNGLNTEAVSVYSQIQTYPMKTLHDSLVRDVRVAVIRFPHIQA